jgi:hypothetical protein
MSRDAFGHLGVHRCRRCYVDHRFAALDSKPFRERTFARTGAAENEDPAPVTQSSILSAQSSVLSPHKVTVRGQTRSRSATMIAFRSPTA